MAESHVGPKHINMIAASVPNVVERAKLVPIAASACFFRCIRSKELRPRAESELAATIFATATPTKDKI